MVDKYSMANLCSRVNFNPCQPSPKVAAEPGQEHRTRPVEPPQLMAEPVQAQRMQPWVADEDLQRAPRGWISFLDDGQVGTQGFEHATILPNPVLV
jgi:hypothetical protein